MTPLEYVQQRKIVAIVRGLKPEYIVRLGHAFEEGGIGLMEVPYDQKAPETWKNTAAAIEAVEKEFGDRVLVGTHNPDSVIFCDMAPFPGINKPLPEKAVMNHPNAMNNLRMGGQVDTIVVQDSKIRATSIKNYILQIAEPDNDSNY